MAPTKVKGDLGVAVISADILKRGYKIAVPFGEDWPFDLIVQRNGKLERIQCKCTESDGEVVHLKCESSNNWSDYKYTQSQVDWMVVYDITSDKCYYVPSSVLGDTGKTMIHLRLTPPKNNWTKKIRLASDYLEF